MSNDQTTIYTEVEAAVDQVLSNKAQTVLGPSSHLVVERSGGVVISPSGKHLIRGVMGQSIPRRGRQYLLLLQYTAVQDAFQLVSAYELAGDHVYSLDAVESAGGQFLLGDLGRPAKTFLQQVQTLLSN